MKRLLSLSTAIILIFMSCTGPRSATKGRVITVSIPPFKYFVEAIAKGDFVVNVMLPMGADHHSWEPLPGQIMALAGSEAFLTDGYLGFEYSWMDRFREVNSTMKISNLSKGIDLLKPVEGEHHEGHEAGEEGTDPHYWMSPKEAYIIAANVRDVLCELNPSRKSYYDLNYNGLISAIADADTIVTRNLKNLPSRSFMIFHPALSYMARDYNLDQVSFENEGKMPSPARMKELIDLTKAKGIKVILVQAEYDIKSAKELANETGTKLIVINPLNPDWDKTVISISDALTGK